MLAPFQDSAVGFHRILQPGRIMKREGLVMDARSLPFSGEHQSQYYDYQDKTYLEMTKDSDVMWSTIVYRPDMITKFLNLRKHNNNKMIYDMDDNFYAVPMDNPASEESKPLKSHFEACIKTADGLTVSVPMLKKLYEKLNKNVYVKKNGLDFTIWDKLKTKKNGKKIRIGWRGAFGHKDDLEMISGVMKALQKDYKVEFVTLGWEGWKGKAEIHKYVTTFEYPEKLASLNLDIAVIPLVDSAFNRCKSNLSYLEFSALKIPTVLSPVENQKGMEAIEARSSYDWYNALEKLIKDKEYREQLGQKAFDFVHKNYDERDLVHDLTKWMDKLERRRDLEPKR